MSLKFQSESVSLKEVAIGHPCAAELYLDLGRKDADVYIPIERRNYMVRVTKIDSSSRESTIDLPSTMKVCKQIKE